MDIQIKEAAAGRVTGIMRTNAKQGSSTTVTTEQEISANKQEYRTRIVVTAKQTNMDRQEASRAIADRLAAQIGGIF